MRILDLNAIMLYLQVGLVVVKYFSGVSLYLITPSLRRQLNFKIATNIIMTQSSPAPLVFFGLRTDNVE